MNSHQHADFMFLLELADLYYELLSGEAKVEIDRIWKDYEESRPTINMREESL
jgi:hypothetical protein